MDEFGSMRFQTRDGKPWVILAGEIDYGIASEQQVTDETITASHPAGQPFTVDLTDVTFIDSVGIALLLRLHNAAPSVKLVNVPARARRVFAAAGLADVFGLNLLSADDTSPSAMMEYDVDDRS